MSPTVLECPTVLESPTLLRDRPPSAASLRAEALRHAATLRERADLDVAYVACSYDTAFEPVEAQVCAKIEGLRTAFGERGWSLWIVDDLPQSAALGAAVLSAYSRYPALRSRGRLRLLPMTSAPPRAGGLKARALLEGFDAALNTGSRDAVVYLNLNAKVDPCFAAPGIQAVLEGSDAAIGTRATSEGGLAEGAGPFGRLKSRAYNALARAILPPLAGYFDTNAPVKAFAPEAAATLVSEARIPGVTMDCEWLLILLERGFTMCRFPIVWTQRPGSRPPWHLVPNSLLDLYRIRRDHHSGGSHARLSS